MMLDHLIGTSESAISEAYGTPQSSEISEYGSTWHIYHHNFKRYIMIGIKDGIVTNVYSNSTDLQIFGIGQGTSREKVRSKLREDLGLPLNSITKGNIRYPISDIGEKDVFTDGTAYYTFFYDMTAGAVLTSVQISGADIEQTTGLFPAASAEMVSSMENISFYLINSIRVRMSLPVLRWDERIAAISRAHSADMAARDYFDHVSPYPDKLSSSGRLKAAGLSYTKCAENIASNHPSAVCAFENLMNSVGHRNNILSSTECTGIGVYMGDGKILLTQMFVTLCD
ncbi:MAG: CAP domain-containing protein [Saccharofermentanales bacterium]